MSLLRHSPHLGRHRLLSKTSCYDSDSCSRTPRFVLSQALKKKKKKKQNPNSDTCSHPPHPTDSHHNIETVSVFRGHPILGSQGTGLFVLQSSINHSCVPNVAYDFDEECKLICATQPAFSLSPLFFSFIVPGTALKDIAEGEELVRPSLT
jgi:SET domain-containing protein